MGTAGLSNLSESIHDSLHLLNRTEDPHPVYSIIPLNSSTISPNSTWNSTLTSNSTPIFTPNSTSPYSSFLSLQNGYGLFSFEIFLSALLIYGLVDMLLQTAVYTFVLLANMKRTCGSISLKILMTSLYIGLRLISIFTAVMSLPKGMAWFIHGTFEVEAMSVFRYFLFVLLFGFSLQTILPTLAATVLLLGGSHKSHRREMPAVANNKRDGEMPDAEFPMVSILMPVYNEEPRVLLDAVRSAIRMDYPRERIHFFISFDDALESPVYLFLLKHLQLLTPELAKQFEHQLEDPTSDGASLYPRHLDCVVEGMRVTISRFVHDGKRATQGKTFGLINQLYGKDKGAYVMLIDSDVILHRNAIHNYVAAMERNQHVIGACGILTCILDSRRYNLLQSLQDAEYVNEELFMRSAEGALGAVTCLPGTFSIVRLRSLQKAAPAYFTEERSGRIWDYHQWDLGDDRYMTYLLLKTGSPGEKTDFICSAHCKTDVPWMLSQLLKQRRRWFLGTITNELEVMTSPQHVRKFPAMIFFKLWVYGITSFNLLTWLMIFAHSQVARDDWTRVWQVYMETKAVYFTTAATLVKLLIHAVSAFRLGRLRLAVYTPLYYLLNPFFVSAVVVYAIWTWNFRSWGGPRTERNPSTATYRQLIREAMEDRPFPYESVIVDLPANGHHASNGVANGNGVVANNGRWERFLYQNK